jgi:hypothetical protein
MHGVEHPISVFTVVLPMLGIQNGWHCIATSIMFLVTDCPTQTETLGKSLSDQADSICKHGSAGSDDIQNGVACYNGTISGSVLSYQCDDGFTIEGNINRVCLSDGSWSGETPDCQPLGNHVCDTIK